MEYLKFPKMTTPKGIAAWSSLVKPNTNFHPEGEYSVSLVLNTGTDEAFLKSIDDLVEKSFEFYQKENPRHAKRIVMVVPYKPRIINEDDGTESPDEVILRFKQKAIVTSKKTGETFTFSIPLFDAAGTLIKPEAVWGGSIVRVNFAPRSYYIAKSFEAGITLQLNAVQILKLVASGKDATSYGFEKEFDNSPPDQDAAEGGAVHEDDDF